LKKTKDYGNQCIAPFVSLKSIYVSLNVSLNTGKCETLIIPCKEGRKH
jgi:hypothetical protein